MTNNSQGNQKKHSLQGMFGKALTVASTGFTAAKILSDQQKIKASEEVVNAAIATANNNISTANATVVEAQAAEQIANVSNTIHAVGAIENVNNIENLTDIDMTNFIPDEGVGNIIDTASTSEEFSEVASSVIESIFSWFDS